MSLYYMSGSGLTPPPVIRSADKHSYLRPEIATMSTEVWDRIPRSEKYVLQVHVLKSFEGSRYITTLILIQDGGTAGNELRYPINRRLCGSQKLSGRFEGQKTSCPCRDSSTTVRECVSNYVLFRNSKTKRPRAPRSCRTTKNSLLVAEPFLKI
jgi:hypothetical protein